MCVCASIIKQCSLKPRTFCTFSRIQACIHVVVVPVDGADSRGEVCLQFSDKALRQTLDTGLICCLWDRHKHTLNKQSEDPHCGWHHSRLVHFYQCAWRDATTGKYFMSVRLHNLKRF